RIVHCSSGWDERAVITALQERQLWPAAPPRARRARSLRQTSLEEARREVLEDARRQLRRLEPYREMYADGDAIRFLCVVVSRARAVVTTLGPDEQLAWDLARAGADLERDAFLLEFSA